MAKKVATRGPSTVPSITVARVIARAMPGGTRRAIGGMTRATGGTTSARRRDFANVPELPTDLFAIATLLLRLSGAYHHIVMDPGDGMSPKRTIHITAVDRERWIEIGKEWASGGVTREPPDDVQILWNKLMLAADEAIALDRPDSKYLPGWWKTAYALMAIADEASADLGYLGSADRRKNWIATTLRDVITPRPTTTTRRSEVHSDNIVSITTDLVDPDVVCVQAKARTPDVGAALRNVSHNLALLPPRKEMGIHWQAPFTSRARPDDTDLNLLLIPFPYRIGLNDFRVCSHGWDHAAKKSAWFDIKQSWLDPGPGVLVKYVEALIAAAKPKVNGIIFPELALNWRSYEKLANRLRDKHHNVEFLVAGSSDNCVGAKGNFALATHFFDVARGKRKSASVSRGKHHRWKLDNHQIQRYRLESSLPLVKDGGGYWEHMSLNHREIHVSAFRSSSVFTVMICEDLARSDPVHEPLRAVGPNLVFVLLMDGPQLPNRWSARYSLGLAEDPGCSVLTLTSRGLVARANAGRDPQSWSVGIWQDGDGGGMPPRKIVCEPGVDAVLVSLKGTKTVEATLDGRSNTHTYVWKLPNDPTPITLSARHSRLRSLMGTDR